MLPITDTIFAQALPWAIAALLLTAGAILLPVWMVPERIKLPVLQTSVFAAIPLLSVILTWLAARPVQVSVDGSWVGALVGTGALAGTTIALTIVGLVAGSNPVVQQYVHASEPHHEARIPKGWIVPLGTATGAFSGLMLGLGNLVLAILTGSIVVTMHW